MTQQTLEEGWTCEPQRRHRSGTNTTLVLDSSGDVCISLNVSAWPQICVRSAITVLSLKPQQWMCLCQEWEAETRLADGWTDWWRVKKEKADYYLKRLCPCSVILSRRCKLWSPVFHFLFCYKVNWVWLKCARGFMNPELFSLINSWKFLENSTTAGTKIFRFYLLLNIHSPWFNA